MKKTIFLLLLMLCYSAYAQSLSVFDIDTYAFPVMKAKFYAFDAGGKQIKSLTTSDFKLTENGMDRTVLSVTCPPDKPAQRLSSVIVIDVSGSMTGTPLAIAKTTAKTWVNALPLGQSECSVTSFDDGNYFNQDFTTNRNKLLSAVDAVGHGGGTDYNKALIEPVASGILVAKAGKYKKVIIFITDGQPNQNPDETRIITEAKANGITIHCITINLTAHQSMKNFADQTGGMWFENVKTEDEAKDITNKILARSLYDSPCEISWQSGTSCVSVIMNVVTKLTSLNITATTIYHSPNSSISKLVFNPSTMKMLNPTPGIKKDTTITITAHNSDFNITDIVSSNPAFTITPTNFSIKAGETKSLKVSYFPADSGYNFTKFDIENDMCKSKYYASGGWKGKKAYTRTIKLIDPNGGEVFIGGSDTIITWEGVSPDEPVTLEYQINNGSWIKLTDTAKGMKYNFHVPRIESNKFLARVTAKAQLASSYCANGDVEIGKQVWMGCNLDVETYRDGTPIPEVQDKTVWDTLTTGAWCYYNNDPANGDIYGKLYNWYAVNDPRGLAPDGWHIPSDAEWKEMEILLGMTQSEADGSGYRGTDEGGKLKEAGLSHWQSPNTGATNSSGFSALPGGYRGINGAFLLIGSNGYWWSSSESNSTYAWWRLLYYDNSYIYRSSHGKGNGFSVRCVRDK
jgi:uncharacterized protein (TIGR02145 family)